MMLTAELIKKVRKIEITTRRIVDEITGGAYHSVFKGRGIEFDEVREYTLNDDVRDIDWNVTARMGSPFVKKFVEERELTVMLAVDASASGFYGSGSQTKHELAVETAALLAFSAIRNHDRVGLMMFTDRTELYLPPRSGRVHGLRLIRELLAHEPAGRKTDLNAALAHLMNSLKKRTVIFLLSDLLNPESFETMLKVVNRRHDVVAVRILDALELALPSLPGLLLEDAETGASSFFPSGNAGRLAYVDAAEQLHRANLDSCRRAKVDIIDLRCGQDLVKPLIQFFNRRQRR